MIQRPGLLARIVIAPSPACTAEFRHHPMLRSPAAYIGLWDDAASPGSSRTPGVRATRTAWSGAAPPPARIAILPLQGGFAEEEARMLERMIFCALEDRVPLLVDLPNGAPLEQDRYARLHAIWASAVVLLGDVAPRLAAPWPGPPILRGHLESGGARLRGTTCGLTATIRRTPDGCVIEAGSHVRRVLPECADPGVRVIRTELVHVGVLAPIDEHAFVLTRDLAMPSRSAARRFAFGQRGRTVDWYPVERRASAPVMPCSGGAR
ncbi:hypothetical protein [Salinarimonas rosea]|uniref:hypothetical protein n=1 Tax=Salinarimonas rosea TaxID=552063 RepID=UPI000410CFB6|nr:hypothetical protein [Salinarimonas rosea]